MYADVQIASDEGEVWCCCPSCDHVWREARIPRLGGPDVEDVIERMAMSCPGCGADIYVEAPLYRAVPEAPIASTVGVLANIPTQAPQTLESAATDTVAPPVAADPTTTTAGAA